MTFPRWVYVALLEQKAAVPPYSRYERLKACPEITCQKRDSSPRCKDLQLPS